MTSKAAPHNPVAMQHGTLTRHTANYSIHYVIAGDVLAVPENHY